MQPSLGLWAVLSKHQHSADLGKEDLVSLPAVSLWSECLYAGEGNAVAAWELLLTVFLW